MSTEIRNWDTIAKAMEAAGTTSSQMYLRAKALAEGKADPMPTTFPAAPFSISAVAGWISAVKTSWSLALTAPLRLDTWQPEVPWSESLTAQKLRTPT